MGSIQRIMDEKINELRSQAGFVVLEPVSVSEAAGQKVIGTCWAMQTRNVSQGANAESS